MLRRIFGSKNDREIKRMRNIVAAINQLEAPLEQYSDEQIEGQKVVFPSRVLPCADLYSPGNDNGPVDFMPNYSFRILFRVATFPACPVRQTSSTSISWMLATS